MTDRYNAIVIELEESIRDDDAESLLQTLRWLKGVKRVVPHVDHWEDQMAVDSAKLELQKKIYEVLKR